MENKCQEKLLKDKYQKRKQLKKVKKINPAFLLLFVTLLLHY